MSSIIEFHRGNEFYGHSHILKKYVNTKYHYPLPAAIQHGWEVKPTFNKWDIETNLPEVWVWSERVKSAYNRLGVNNVRIIGAPIIYLNIKENKKISKKGTIVFPAHRSPCSEIKGKFEEYGEMLRNLPKEFHPITVCLYYLDIDEEIGKVFKKMNFKIVSNGPRENPKFLHNFIQNTLNHKYITSNEISSATFYGIYLGLNFFYYGKSVEYINHSDPHDPLGAMNWDKCDFIENAKKRFNINNIDEIENQKEWAFEELGMGFKKTPDELYDLIKTNEMRLSDWGTELSGENKDDFMHKIYHSASYLKKAKDLRGALKYFSSITKMKIDENIFVEKKIVSGAYFHCGEIEYHLGNKRKASNNFESCLRYNNENKDAKRYIEILAKNND